MSLCSAAGSAPPHRGKLPALFQRICGIQLWVHDRKFLSVKRLRNSSMQVQSNEGQDVGSHNAQPDLPLAPLFSFLTCLKKKESFSLTDSNLTLLSCEITNASGHSAMAARPGGRMFSCRASPFCFPAKSGRLFCVETVQREGELSF